MLQISCVSIISMEYYSSFTVALKGFLSFFHMVHLLGVKTDAIFRVLFFYSRGNVKGAANEKQ
ncbi:hypothetical protein C4B60_16955 [Jeotgalibacillus proteolyticus]|uniref:Uncharacterized protein n=1 Tax=Jeotgalibacillus proteolyticus TaxID=2082395 RepID=A0A2S5G8Z6_9BACL|nr:hypothetical protein C4B60_16955 [Jeotgalibacillus proteolyticus]